MPISYDLPVKDFIAGLNATGHVGHSGYPTHAKFKKTSVTIHHNGGNLTLEGVLQTWVARPASAHFDVDANGNVGQYVEADEYAWAVGDVAGNESTISIEQADATFAPNWEVGEATWKGASRLAGWLFANVVGERPSSSNMFPHQHWSSTDCPGPYVMRIFPQMIAEAQSWYDHFKGTSPSPSPTPTPTPAPAKKTIAQIALEVIDGKWGNGPDRVHRLTVAGYDPVAVQAQVNKDLGGSSSSPTSAATIAAVAREVINGKFGNGPARVAALKKAGYDPVAVQAEVNRLLA